MASPFEGEWRIDLGRSVVWDAATRAYVKDEVGEELITLRIEDDVQDYEVRYGDDPMVRMGYRSRYDDPTWVPYEVREVSSASDDVEGAVAAMKRRLKADVGSRERHFVVGRAYGLTSETIVIVPASASRRAACAVRRTFSARSSGLNPRLPLRPWRRLSPSRR